MAEEMIFGANAHLRSKGRIELQSAGRANLLLLQLFGGLVRHSKMTIQSGSLKTAVKVWGYENKFDLLCTYLYLINRDSIKFNSKSCYHNQSIIFSIVLG